MSRIPAIAIAMLCSSFSISTVQAACTESPADTFTCDTSEPNPDLVGIQQIGNHNGLLVNMLPGSIIDTAGTGTQAIRLGDGNNQITLTEAEVNAPGNNGIESGQGAITEINIIDSAVSCDDDCIDTRATGTAQVTVVRSSIVSHDNNGIDSDAAEDTVFVEDSFIRSGLVGNNFGIWTRDANDQVTITNSHVAGYVTDGPGSAIILGLGDDSLTLRDGAELVGKIDCGNRSSPGDGTEDTVTFEMVVPQSELAALQAELASAGTDDSITINGRFYEWVECENLVDNLTGGNPGDTRATFEVTKYFGDGNTDAEVEVSLSCNTGLILDQSKNLSHGESVEFVLTSAGFGEANCEITETPLSGYSAAYDDGFIESEVSCVFENVDDGDENHCTITNSLQPVQVLITKQWLYEGSGGQPVNEDFRVTLNCVDSPGQGGEIDGGSDEGSYWTRPVDSNGNISISLYVYPYWAGGTDCHVVESNIDSSVESDASDCDNLLVTVNSGDECTVTNSVFYEGIPTLDQYGKLMLALLLLGMGVFAMRRLT
jgi:hypothetical protein